MIYPFIIVLHVDSCIALMKSIIEIAKTWIGVRNELRVRTWMLSLCAAYCRFDLKWFRFHFHIHLQPCAVQMARSIFCSSESHAVINTLISIKPFGRSPIRHRRRCHYHGIYCSVRLIVFIMNGFLWFCIQRHKKASPYPWYAHDIAGTHAPKSWYVGSSLLLLLVIFGSVASPALGLVCL